jgi:serine/threonine protein kinase
LRARVEALLLANEASFLPPQNDANRTGDYTPNDLNPGAELPNATYCIGAVLAGKYRLIEEIGEGGMGSVYLADQTEPVRRQVAVKLIKGGMDSKAVLARFDAERQALALMDHPNIARIYDGGVTPSGQPFFVMELVKGAPLTDYCDRHQLPVKARLELFISVCQAVQHAHQKGIIHRDLKPGNVLVTEVDGRPTPKVIDFGVAKATDQRAQQSLRQAFVEPCEIVVSLLGGSHHQPSGRPSLEDAYRQSQSMGGNRSACSRRAKPSNRAACFFWASPVRARASLPRRSAMKRAGRR